MPLPTTIETTFEKLLLAPNNLDLLAEHANALPPGPRRIYAQAVLAFRARPDSTDFAALRRAYPANASDWTGPLELSGAFPRSLLPGMYCQWPRHCQPGAITYRVELDQTPIPFERFDGTLQWLEEPSADVRRSGRDLYEERETMA